MSAQTIATMMITLNFISMTCETFNMFWLYIGIVLSGGILFWTARHLVSRQCSVALRPPDFISQFEDEFDVRIRLLPSQKIKAFVHQNNIYITMGLVERLELPELRAVIAHEVYHVRNSPNKVLSSFLAVTSLTFKRHNDDPAADKFAAELIGKEHLIQAFKTLQIVDGETRSRKLT